MVGEGDFPCVKEVKEVCDSVSVSVSLCACVSVCESVCVCV